MKGTKIYLLTAFIVTLIITVICTVVCSAGLARIREESFRSQSGLVAAVREHYPGLSDREIIDSLSSPTNTADTERMLRSYSITESDWLSAYGVPFPRHTHSV